MLEAILNSLCAVAVVAVVAGVGFYFAHKGTFNEQSRALIAKLVNISLPCFLFYSVAARFTHDQFMELAQSLTLPFIVIFINFLFSILFIKIGWVAKERAGTFISCFSGSTVLFVGVPIVMAMYGERGIPYVLEYFIANCLFIWTVGLYNIQLDNVRRVGGKAPKLWSFKSIRMLFKPPLIGCALGLLCVLVSLKVPDTIMMITRYLGNLTTPLALIFVGITVQMVGFGRLKKMPRELWLILFACYVLRPIITYCAARPFGLDPFMLRVFMIVSALPVSSVISVLSKAYGGDAEFAAEAIGASTAAVVFAMPVILVIVNLI